MTLVIPGNPYPKGIDGNIGNTGADGPTGPCPSTISFTVPTAPVITGSYPHWVKTSVSYSSFQTLGTTKTLTLFTAPSKTIVHAAGIKPTTRWQGRGIFGIKMSVGAGLTPEQLKTYFNVDTTPSDGNLQFEWLPRIWSIGTTTTLITSTVTITSGNLNSLSKGAADIYLLISKL